MNFFRMIRMAVMTTVLSGVLVGSGFAQTPDPLTVRTVSGSVTGVSSNDIEAWMGIHPVVTTGSRTS